MSTKEDIGTPVELSAVEERLCHQVAWQLFGFTSSFSSVRVRIRRCGGDVDIDILVHICVCAVQGSVILGRSERVEQLGGPSTASSAHGIGHYEGDSFHHLAAK